MVKKIVLFSFIAICFIGAVAFTGIQITRLNNTQDTLASTQNELASTQSDILNTGNTLASTDAELSLIQSDLWNDQDKLSKTLSEMQYIYQKIDSIGSEIDKTQDTIYKANAQLDDEKNSNAALNIDLVDIQSDYNSTTSGYSYVFRDPTYEELKDFLKADTSDLNEYNTATYVCEDFSFDVRLHAMQQKIRCAYVYLIFAGIRHAMIGFNTTDKGIIYIEPQLDREVNLQVGWHYWSECVIPHNPPVTTYNDTVTQYYLIW